MALIVMIIFNIVVLIYLIATGNEKNEKSRVEREEEILRKDLDS